MDFVAAAGLFEVLQRGYQVSFRRHLHSPGGAEGVAIEAVRGDTKFGVFLADPQSYQALNSALEKLPNIPA